MSLKTRLHRLSRGTKAVAYDARVALKAHRHGVPLFISWRISREARHENLPKRIAYALVEQESLFKNIFGCDSGGLYCHEAVTKDKVYEILRTGRYNGVGLTQITSREFVEQANAMGGAWKPKYQCRVGFRFMHQLIVQYGKGGMWHYNGSSVYQPQIESKVRKWAAILH